VFPARLNRVPVNLEGAVRGRKHSRVHPAYSLRFGHLAKPYTEAEAEGNLPWVQQGLRISWQEGADVLRRTG
jgi:hypothetical protein